MQRGRRSAASNVLPLNASQARPKLTPLGTLTKNENRIFDHTVCTNLHLKLADIPMLELYCMAYCRAVLKRRKGGPEWERESRVMMAFATKLRLTPQSTTEPKTAARLRAEAEPVTRKPWDRDKDDT